MKGFDDYEKTARPGAAFSNSTSFEGWSYSVCDGGGIGHQRCVNDDTADDDGGCPLLMLAILGEKTPVEWDLGDRPDCTEKTTAAEQRRARRAAELAADRAAIEAQHYAPLFDIETGA